MKRWKIITALLLLSAVMATSFACGSDSDEAATVEYQEVVVQRGDLAIEINASGNLALSQSDELTFEIDGTVDEVLVDEGDTVTEGQVLARLDASEWEDHLEELEDGLTTAERQLRTRERAVTAAELNLDAKKRLVTAAERDLLQAQVNVQSAQRALDIMADVQEAQDAVDEAEVNLQIAKVRLQESLQSSAGGESGDPNYWLHWISVYTKQLEEAREELNEVLTDPYYGGVTISEVYLKQQQLELAEKNLAAAEEAVEVARVNVAEAGEDIVDAEIALADAQQDLVDAEEELDEARETSLEITAPFDGFITRVNAEGGDEVMRGTVIAQIADPDKFEADIMVSEMDIVQVKLGGEAWVEVDALPGISLPAEVTHISPTATIQSGVVNYGVTVELKPVEAIRQERQAAKGQAMPNKTSGELPDKLKQAIEEGSITREQAEEMMQQFPKGRLPSGAPAGKTGQLPLSTSLKDIQLREGLTVIVNIIVEEKNNVLLVPNQAITQRGTESYVRVSTDGVVEERLVQTGISNWQSTEITGGLSEGETVLVPKGTTATVSTTSQNKPGGRMPLFGPPPPRK